MIAGTNAPLTIFVQLGSSGRAEKRADLFRLPAA